MPWSYVTPGARYLRFVFQSVIMPIGSPIDSNSWKRANSVIMLVIAECSDGNLSRRDSIKIPPEPAIPTDTLSAMITVFTHTDSALFLSTDIPDYH